jgi:hypothetical protein
MRIRRSDIGFYIEPVGPGRHATARVRRARGAAHSRAAVGPTETALDPFAPSCHAFSLARSIETLSQEPHTKSKENFPLEPRAKTTWQSDLSPGWSLCLQSGP